MNIRKSLLGFASLICCVSAVAQAGYRPAPENIEARARFSDNRFGIFLHWGLYAMHGQGEWGMTWQNIHYREYEKLAGGFCPASFDAKAWVTAFREAGARYICITSRHHDGFSMFHTAQSPYNIVDATPFGRDVLKELADECHRQGIALHFYYSLIDWWREDAPRGFTGRGTGRPDDTVDFDAYMNFMKAQLTELLTNYGEIGAIWFDGVWDKNENPGFDWRLGELYSLIHSLQPACLVINNHHLTPFEGEDAQTFERDLPGENTAGMSGQEVSRLPLETCQTMNGTWGYSITDRNYKSSDELIRYLVRAAGLGGNLLLDIGPRADGSIPDEEVAILKTLGRWTSKHAEAIYGTRAGIPAGHVQGYTSLSHDGTTLYIYLPYRPTGPLEVKGLKSRVRRARVVGDGTELDWRLYNDISWSEVPGVYYFDIPHNALDPEITVIALELDSPATLYRGAGQVITANE